LIPELRGTLAALRYPCFGEIKYDGEATVISYDQNWENQIVTSNKYGTMRSEWSKLDALADMLEQKDIVKATFLAELFYGEGHAGALYELLSNKSNDDLNLVIYDVIYLETEFNKFEGTKMPLIDRKELMLEMVPKDLLVNSHVCKDQNDIDTFFQDVVEMGYEGIVVKNFDSKLQTGPCSWMKMKYKDQTEFKVTMIDQTKERAEIEIDKPDGTKATCGVKISNSRKKEFKVGDMIVIEHQGFLDSGSLRHPVYVKIADPFKE